MRRRRRIPLVHETLVAGRGVPPPGRSKTMALGAARSSTPGQWLGAQWPRLSRCWGAPEPPGVPAGAVATSIRGSPRRTCERAAKQTNGGAQQAVAARVGGDVQVHLLGVRLGYSYFVNALCSTIFALAAGTR